MKRLGVIARADDGGLGTQTRDIVAALGPDVVLVVLLGENARGSESSWRVKNPNGPLDARQAVNNGPRLFDENIDQVLAACDVLYTVEGPYHGDGVDLFHRCNDEGVELVIHANPELYKGFPCHRLLVPTTWRLDQMPSTAEVVAHPVDVGRLRPTVRDEIPTFVHLTGPAMLDRQGTQLVTAALPFVQHECFLWIRRPDRHLVDEQVGNVHVGWLPPADDYWDAIPSGCWALLQPRRYGGLSLCVQEAAARGLPTIALDREPESTFYEAITVRCPLTEEQPYPMAGGEVGVADTDPRALAAVIDDFIDRHDHFETTIDARGWAEARSWDVLRPVYESILR